jgi:iron complex outermembrane receptor protein
MTFTRRAALLALPVLIPAPACAAAGRSSIIVTAASANDRGSAIQQTPGGIDLVDRAQFADKLAVSLRDTLAFSPGVYAQPRFGQEIRISIRGSGISRGFHMRGLMLFQDGIPINLADNNADFQEFDPQVFQQIEVYRGGNALRFGGSTLGGAINAITPTGRTAPGVQLRIDGGSFDTIRGKTAVGFATQHGDAFLALSGDSSDGDRDHAWRSSLRFNGNVGIGLNDRIETRFYANINHIKQRLPGALTYDQALSTPKRSLPANVTDDQQRDIDSIRLQNRTTIDLGSGALAFGAFANIKQLFHPIFQVVDQKSVDYGAFARLDLAGEIGGVPMEASLGSTARFNHVQNRQYVNVAGHRGAQTVDGRQEARTIDSYGEIRLKPVGGLALIAGGVFTSGNRDVINFRDPSRSGSADYESFAPRIGLLYQSHAGVQFYANYSRSVELPGFIELNQTPFAVSGIVTPGFVNVRPQKAWTFEVGTRGTLGIAAWDVTLYRANIRDELLQFDQASGLPAATFNADRTRHQGIEAGLSLRLAPWAELRQVYQFNDFRFRNDALYGDNRLPVVPKHLYRAALKLGTDHASVSPNLEWVPTGAWADYRNGARASGYALIGLSAETSVRPGVVLFIDMRNLANKRAIGDISAAVLAAPASALYYPVERRAFYGGVRAAF